MTVKLQELAIKSELKVAMRYKIFKTVAMRCKYKCYMKFKKSACYKRLRYFITKFLSMYLFLWGHELASSFRLFRLHKFFLQVITNFSERHVTFVANVAIRSALLNNSPLDGKRFVFVFECPNVF